MSDQKSVRTVNLAYFDLGLLMYAVAAFATVLIFDRLLFDQVFGFNLFLAFVALLFGIAAFRDVNVPRNQQISGAIFGFACILPLVEDVSYYSLTLGVFGLVAFSVACGSRHVRHPVDFNLLGFARDTPIEMYRNFKRFVPLLEMTLSSFRLTSGLVAWAMPLVIGSLFLLLFVAANPVIQAWFSFDWLALEFGELEPIRIFFWSVTFVLFLALAGRKARRLKVADQRGGSDYWTEGSIRKSVFGDYAVTRSLVLFNILFMLQTITDLVYLWTGFALPDGMSYAEYAHRGAYPLLATSLLAIAFILFTMRRNGPGESSSFLRKLLCFWVAQNLFLVFSSLYRLQLYVNEYSLTGLRFAAAIWMAMVFIGLVTILVRIFKAKDNGWLMSVNWVAVVFVFLFASLFDFEHFIARYNVEHSYEISGVGQPLDIEYLQNFGPGALPAINSALSNNNGFTAGRQQQLRSLRAKLQKDLRSSSCNDWRCFSLRTARYKATLVTK